MSNDELYAGREQTFVKHFVLQKYLERFAHIIGSWCNTITYVDCFSGPWNVRSNKFADSSFATALNELRKARDAHTQRGKDVSIRCFFLEADPTAYSRLDEFARTIDYATIETRNAALEQSIPEILDFVRRGGQNSFPFILIDPSGWAGFELDTIAPLLQCRPGEVLINFMTSAIRRFIDSPQYETKESFRKMFGSEDFRETIATLSGQDRDDAAVGEYALNVKRTGGFNHTCTAIVLDPQKDQTHYHLIYATRNVKGVEVFKDVEKKAMQVQEKARADAQQRRRISKAGQSELFNSKEMHDPSYYNRLRERYLEKSRRLLLGVLEKRRRLPYDEAWLLALSEPMTWGSDLKMWLEEWQKAGHLNIEGLRERQRVPARGKKHILIWT
ncbi:MAG: three-Cys-motif partner protein TcmP [Nitrospirae bacterium]|nr:three-Cys-motif partner protein TcmP [Nitrospirota bacterium]